VLRARFVRQRGQRDRVYVVRSDGSEASWVFPSYGDGLPHDLVHLVAESAFGVTDGFWGHVDRGADPQRINDEANRRGGRDKYSAFGDDRRGLLLAEALANLAWTVDGVRDEDRRKMVAKACTALGVSLPVSVTQESIAAVRARLDDLRAVWRGFKEKGALELQFESERPARAATR
jgi:hypothetical protein